MAPLSHFPPDHAGSERSSLPLFLRARQYATRAESRGHGAPASSPGGGLRPASRGSAKPAPTTPPPTNLTAANDISPICAESRRQWSAGLRPASRGSAKPAPMTVRRTDVSGAPPAQSGLRCSLRFAQRCRPEVGVPLPARHRARGGTRRDASPGGSLRAPKVKGGGGPPFTLSPRSRRQRTEFAAICLLRARQYATRAESRGHGASVSDRHRMERRSPTGIARERETSADDGAPYRREWRTPCSIGIAPSARLRRAVPTRGRRSLACAPPSPWGHPPRCVARRLASRSEGERGRWPPFHTFPPITRAANGVRCHCFCALGSTPPAQNRGDMERWPVLPVGASDRHRAEARNPHQQRCAPPISPLRTAYRRSALNRGDVERWPVLPVPVSDRHRAGARNPPQQRRPPPISPLRTLSSIAAVSARSPMGPYGLQPRAESCVGRHAQLCVVVKEVAEREVAEGQRQRSAQLGAVNRQVPQIAELAELGRYRARQLVVPHEQLLQVGEPANLGRDRAGQPVLGKPKTRQAGQSASFRGDCPGTGYPGATEPSNERADRFRAEWSRSAGFAQPKDSPGGRVGRSPGGLPRSTGYPRATNPSNERADRFRPEWSRSARYFEAKDSPSGRVGQSPGGSPRPTG